MCKMSPKQLERANEASRVAVSISASGLTGAKTGGNHVELRAAVLSGSGSQLPVHV